MANNDYVFGSDPRIVLTVNTKEPPEEPLDISAATAQKFLFKGDNGDELMRDAVFLTDGTDGKLYYDIINDELAVGRWQVQALVTIDGKDDYTSPVTFVVTARLF